MAGTKVKRSKLAIFLDTSGGEETAEWALIGNGVTEQTIAYNPTTSDEVYIHQDSGTVDVESYKPNIPTPMTAIKAIQCLIMWMGSERRELLVLTPALKSVSCICMRRKPPELIRPSRMIALSKLMISAVRAVNRQRSISRST